MFKEQKINTSCSHLLNSYEQIVLWNASPVLCGLLSILKFSHKDIMGTILFKPDQAFGEGLFFDNRECKERRLANMPTRALAF